MAEKIVVTPQYLESAAAELRNAQGNFEGSLNRVSVAVGNLSDTWRDELHSLAQGKYETELHKRLTEIPETLNAFADMITSSLRVFENVDSELKSRIWAEKFSIAVGLVPVVGTMPVPPRKTPLGDLLRNEPNDPITSTPKQPDENGKTALGTLLKDSEKYGQPQRGSVVGQHPVPDKMGERDTGTEYTRSTIGFDKTVKKYKDDSGEIKYGAVHAGYDIVGSLDDPIYSSADGKVIVNQNNPGGYGNYIVLEYAVNGKYYYATYAHLNATPPFSIGDTIPAGTAFGKMGNSGEGSNGYIHLHLDVRCNDDPTKQLDSSTLFGSGRHFVNPKEFFGTVGVSL